MDALGCVWRRMTRSAERIHCERALLLVLVVMLMLSRLLLPLDSIRVGRRVGVGI